MIWITLLCLAAFFGSGIAAKASAQANTTLTVRDNTTDYVKTQSSNRAGDPSDENLRFKDPRSDDLDPYTKLRDAFSSGTADDPIQHKFEQLFGEPYPSKGFPPYNAKNPFSDVKKWDDAFELQGVAGARTEVKADGAVVTVSFDVPESLGKQVDVYVNEDRILLSIFAPAPTEKYRFPHRQDLAVPLPLVADIRSTVVDRSGDSITLYFKEMQGHN